MKKRILYIGNALTHSRASKTTIESLSKLLQEDGYIVHVASNKHNKLLRMIDMICITLRLSKKIDLVLIDTYSTTNFWYAVIIGRLCQVLKKPYIPILHGGDLPNRIERSPKLSHTLFNNAKVNIAPSDYLISAFRDSKITNVRYIPNVITLDNYPYSLREPIGPKLLWVRSFSQIYNPIMALAVFKELQKKFPDATLTMVGPAKDQSYDECLAFAKTQNLTVNFTGLLSKEAWLALAASHDIFINTTNFDNTPVSVIEAMALGLPVVSTKVGGMSFLINDGKDGLLSPPRDVQTFVDNVSRLLNDPTLAQKLAQNARRKAESFDWSTVKSLWEEVLS